MPALTKSVNDRNSDVRRVASLALAKIAAALREADRTDAIRVLKDAQAAIEHSEDPRVKAQAPDLADAVEGPGGAAPRARSLIHERRAR